MTEEKKMRIIKRYSNRKLYDTQDSRYVTLDEIAVLVKSGEDIHILDNRSGDDLTELTLAQILFEEQKKRKTRMPLSMLKDLISSSGDSISEFLQRKVAHPVQTFKEEAERRVEEIRKLGESTVEDTAKQVKDFFAATQHSLDEIQKKIDGSIQGVLSSMPAVRGQLESLRHRIEELEAKLRPSDENEQNPRNTDNTNKTED